MMELGELYTTRTGWRRFLLFQSRRQFLEWAALIASIFVIGVVSVTLMGGHPLSLFGPAAGGIAGALPGLWLTRHACFHVRGPARAQALAAIDAGLRVQRYRPAAAGERNQLYRLALPRLLRWGEQDVRLVLSHDEMVLSGPYVALRFVRRYLAASLADARC